MDKSQDMIIRKAKVTEARYIKELIDANAEKGLMLSRSLDQIYNNIRDFTVCLHNDHLAGVCALSVFTEEFAEIRSLAVREDYRKKNIGSHLVKACITEAFDYEMRNVFTLTYIPEYFKKLHFLPVSKDDLPHKIWRDCVNCEHFYHCDEEAMIYRMEH